MPDPAAWGLPAQSFRPLANGARNTVLLGNAASPRTVFKSTRRDDSQLDWQDKVQAAAVEAGFVAPRMKQTLAGTWHADGWIAETYIPGRAASPQDIAKMGTRLARFHRLSAHLPQRPGFASSRELCATMLGGDVDLTGMPPDLVSRLRAAWAGVPTSPTCAIHGDLSEGNLAMAPSGRPILYDFDEARRDHPGFDRAALGQKVDPCISVAALAFEIACCWQIEPERAAQLVPELVLQSGLDG